MADPVETPVTVTVTVTADEVREFLGAKAGHEDDAALTTNIEAAAALLAKLIGSAAVPDAVRKQALLETAADMYDRRSTRGGVLNAENYSYEAAPVRVSVDPLFAAKRLLSVYLGQAIA